MNIHCRYDRLVPVKELVPHPKNRNKHPQDQIERLSKIIAYQGVRAPIVVSRLSGYIVKGHGTLLAIKKNKMKEAPVVEQDFTDADQEYAFLQSDNAIASWAELDVESIKGDLSDLIPGFDTDLLGLKDLDIGVADADKEAIEDDVPDVTKSISKLGDLYELGEHRLLCGDSTDKATVERLMNGEKVDITFTSPPYNAAKNGHLTGNVSGFDNKYKSHNDEMTDDDYFSLLVNSTEIAIEKSDYTFINIQMLTHNRNPLFRYQAQFQDLIKDIFIWNKRQCPPNIVKGAFNTKWEYVFCFSENNKTRGFPCEWQGQYPNVVETESNSGNEFAESHKAGFPVAFPLWFLDKFDFAKSVYDPFGGTGTTLIACEKTNRKCYMMELDPHYVDVIVSRWCRYTGKKEIKRNGEPMEWTINT